MSSQEQHRGILTKVWNVGSLENTAKIILENHGIKIRNDLYSTTIDQVRDDLYEDYILFGENFYKIEDHYVNDVCEAVMNEDGTISYSVDFYNGGAGLQEVIEHTLNKMKEKLDIIN